jgi:hypothetical protein
VWCDLNVTKEVEEIPDEMCTVLSLFFNSTHSHFQNASRKDRSQYCNVIARYYQRGITNWKSIGSHRPFFLICCKRFAVNEHTIKHVSDVSKKFNFNLRH